MSRDPVRKQAVAIRCAAPDAGEDLLEAMWDVTPGARANVAFLTLPYGFLSPGASADTANRVLDQVWACSAYVRDTLIDRGFFADKVVNMPLGYAPDVFHPDIAPAALPTQKRFRFIHVSIPFITYKGIDNCSTSGGAVGEAD